MRPSRFINLFLATALILVFALPSLSQDINLANFDSMQSGMVHFNTGLEYAFTVSAGYSRTVEIVGHKMLFTGGFTLPYAKLDLGDYLVECSLLAPLAGKNKWRLAGRASPILRGLKNKYATLTNLGTDFSLLGGYYRDRYFVGAELGFDWAFTTHIKHDDYYLTYIYAEAKDGWYGPAGGNWHVGLVCGYSFGNKDVTLRLGQGRDLYFRAQSIPAYLTIGFNWHY